MSGLGSVSTSTYEMARRFVGLREIEVKGQDHPWIQAFFTTSGYGPDTPDETPWCSAFVNGVCWLLGLPHSHSARARSWLKVGTPIPLIDADLGDVVILKRGKGPQPGPEVIAAPGHVGFYAGMEGLKVRILGGNQSNAVGYAPFDVGQILGVRRIVHKAVIS